MRKAIKDCTYKEFMDSFELNKLDKFYMDIKRALDGAYKYAVGKITDEAVINQIMEEAMKGILASVDITYSLNQINVK